MITRQISRTHVLYWCDLDGEGMIDAATDETLREAGYVPALDLAAAKPATCGEQAQRPVVCAECQYDGTPLDTFPCRGCITIKGEQSNFTRRLPVVEKDRKCATCKHSHGDKCTDPEIGPCHVPVLQHWQPRPAAGEVSR